MEVSEIKYKEPEKFIIVPYRDRKRHLQVFLNHMEHILEDENYLMLIIHQDDKRNFNRGALKNIGFLYIKNLYPSTYKEKTLIYHDVDYVVWKKDIFDFKTQKGIVKHHYGFPPNIAKNLGGVFTIKAMDFEKVNGFPNYWSWGYEDNIFYNRIINKGIKIDYSSFRSIKHPDVVMFWDGYNKKVNENYLFNSIKNEKGWGINQISNVTYDLSDYENRKKLMFINVKTFNVPGNYPKLESKIPSGGFQNKNHRNMYNNLWGRNN